MRVCFFPARRYYETRLTEETAALVSGSERA